MVSISSFRKIIWGYYKKNKRDLPWRETTNPYHIFLSEIMLQQTQVHRVTPKYTEFIKTFPDFPTLSKAPFEQVLTLWSGLGYNRRALYLKKSAETIVQEHQGTVPKNPIELEKLPGIGKATAASIIVYSYNAPLVFIETNIRRVFIHHFFKDKEQVQDNELLPYVERSLDKENPREWYWALMDYGSYLSKIVENPNHKSKHYVKQSKFEGSVRQVRGRILRELLVHKKIKILELKKIIFSEHFDVALSQLEKEGFVKIDKKNIGLNRG